MKYIGIHENLLLLDNEGYPLNIKINDMLEEHGYLYVNYKSPRYKAVLVDLHTRIATLSY